MWGLAFEEHVRVERVVAPRADIALFVGWIEWRVSALPQPIREWYEARRYPLPAPGAPLPFGLPVPVESWESFDSLFDWRARPVDAASPAVLADTLLGVAVRDFFANGGRKCYVVPLGAPWPVSAVLGDDERAARLRALLPEFVDNARETWRGLAHLRGLDDVALVLAPDLPAIVADAPQRLAPAAPADLPAEVFVECGTHAEAGSGTPGILRVPAPRTGDAAYAVWNAFVARAAAFVRRFRPEAMLLLAVPLPADRSRAARSLFDVVGADSAFVQLAYPWLRPTIPPRVPEGVVAPDGALAGLVAGSALSQGAFRSVAGRRPVGVFNVEPVPPSDQLRVPRPGKEDEAWSSRLAMFGPTLRGIELLSDRTCTRDASWRQAGVGRLMGQLLRLARRVGEELAFEPSGERLWTRIRERFADLLTALWQLGALKGATPAQAFDVRCGRDVITQADLDAGRAVCIVSFTPALAIDRIRVHLSLAEDGTIVWSDETGQLESLA
jgi:hypothetical protein